MLIIRQKMIYRTDLQANPNLLYVFGDNLMRVGFGGQAKEMRGEINSLGIATKRLPEHGRYDCYFHDDQKCAWQSVDLDFKRLKVTSKIYKGIVIPADGLGTGLAKLSEYAPKLLAHIELCIKELGE